MLSMISDSQRVYSPENPAWLEMLISNLDFQRVEPPMKPVLVDILLMEESQRIEPPRTPMVTEISTGRMLLYTHPQSWKKCLKCCSKFVVQGRMPGP